MLLAGFLVYCSVRVVKKMGYEWPLAIFAVLCSPVALIIAAFAEWPIQRDVKRLKRRLDRKQRMTETEEEAAGPP